VLLDQAPHLKMIANYGVGYDHIDVPAASGRGILVSNTPGVLTDATADLTMALILGIGRRIVEGDDKTRRGEFKFWSPMHFLGREISGKTLGLVGLGRIGKAVARRAAGFDMRIVYFSRHRLSPESEGRLGVSYRSLADLLDEADYVSLHVSLSPKTHHLIGPDELDRMKSSAFLINTSRGPVVDEEALVVALKANRIAGAGLDVYEKEPELTPGLADLENCILLPLDPSLSFISQYYSMIQWSGQYQSDYNHNLCIVDLLILHILVTNSIFLLVMIIPFLFCFLSSLSC
jgi:glyoxylate reductase